MTGAPVTTERRARAPLLTPPFLLVTLATLAYFLSIGATLPILPRFVQGPLGGSSVSVGLGVGAFTATAFFLRPLAGRIGDRRGRRLLLIGGAAIVSLSILGYLLSDSIAVLVGFRLLTGVGEAFFFTGGGSVIHDLAPEERRAEAVSYFSLALYGGLAAGPVLGEAVLDAGGYDAVWALAAVGSAGAAALALLVPDTRPANEGPPAAGRIVHPAAFLPGAVLTTSVWGFSAFSAFIPLYALQVGMDGSRFVFLTYAVVVLLVRSIGARIPDAYGPRRTVATALVGSMIGLTVMAAWDRPAGLFVGAFVLGLGHSLTFPGLMTIAVRGAPASERGAVVGTFTAFFDLSFGIGAVTLGAVAEVLGYRGAFLAAAGVALAGVLLLLRLRSAPTMPLPERREA